MNKFNKELGLKDKAIINFDGLGYRFMDIDAISVNKDCVVYVEEKYIWSKKENIYFQQKLMDKINVPVLLICTRNPKDISQEKEKIINLKDSIVVDFYTNDERFYCYWSRMTKGLIKKDYFIGKKITELLDIWTCFVYGNTKPYWMKS